MASPLEESDREELCKAIRSFASADNRKRGAYETYSNGEHKQEDRQRDQQDHLLFSGVLEILANSN